MNTGSDPVWFVLKCSLQSPHAAAISSLSLLSYPTFHTSLNNVSVQDLTIAIYNWTATWVQHFGEHCEHKAHHQEKHVEGSVLGCPFTFDVKECMWGRGMYVLILPHFKSTVYIYTVRWLLSLTCLLSMWRAGGFFLTFVLVWKNV